MSEDVFNLMREGLTEALAVARGEAINSDGHHYRGAGLEGIYLLNGYSVGPRGTVISDIDGLHKAIGRHLVLHRKLLSPREIKFLRNTMGVTQSEMASRMLVDVQTFARWEKGQSTLPGPADVLLRIFYMASLMPEKEAYDFTAAVLQKIQDLAELDEVRTTTAAFKLSDHWAETPDIVRETEVA